MNKVCWNNKNSSYEFINDRNNILENDESFYKQGNSFISNCDTRIRNNNTGDVIGLDRKPFRLYNDFYNTQDTIYQDSYTKAGLNYKNYSDIDAGNIVYYISGDIKAPFPDVAYDLNGNVNTDYSYTDPMGNKRIQHNFKPENKVSCVYSKNKDYYGNLSYINDTSIQREEIMALQSRKANEQKFSAAQN